MTAHLIVPGVCRFTTHGEVSGLDVSNIWDVNISDLGIGTSRAEAIENHAGQIINAWCELILPALSSEYSFIEVSWLDLDDIDGSTGSRSSTDDFTLPLPGGGSASGLVANVSVLVKKAVSAGRSARSGRAFVAGYPENTTAGDANHVDPTVLASYQGNWDDFLDAIGEDLDGTIVYSPDLNVVHITARDGDGHPTEGEGIHVTALQVQSLLATQRRRLRGRS